MSTKNMLKNCISVSDLKKDVNGILKNLKEPKFIFVNNKPTAVLIRPDDLDDWEIVFNPPMRPADILAEYEEAYGKKISQKPTQKRIQKTTIHTTGGSRKR